MDGINAGNNNEVAEILNNYQGDGSGIYGIKIWNKKWYKNKNKIIRDEKVSQLKQVKLNETGPDGLHLFDLKELRRGNKGIMTHFLRRLEYLITKILFRKTSYGYEIMTEPAFNCGHKAK